MTSHTAAPVAVAQRMPVEDASQVSVARALAVRTAVAAGFATGSVHSIALAATELAENLHRHARGGELIVIPPGAGSARLAVLAVDRGPGVENFEQCLDDGYTTTGTLGAGLGSVRRLAGDFDAVSEPGRGTVVSAGFAVGGATAGPVTNHFDVGAVGFPIAGEEHNGDSYACVRQGSRLVVLLADGLGHGVHAAQASSVAAAELPTLADRAPAELIAALNVRLTRTRGAAVSVAGLELEAARRGGTVRSSGLGNVSVLVSGLDGDSHRVATMHGTAGARVRVSTSEQATAFPAKGVLILHSDGLTTRWSLDGRAALLRHRAEVIAAALWRDHDRGTDDSLIVVVRAAVPSAVPAAP